MTESGISIELTFLFGEDNDVRGLDLLLLCLSSVSKLFMDAGYTDYEAEDATPETADIEFAIQRKKNTQHSDDYW